MSGLIALNPGVYIYGGNNDAQAASTVADGAQQRLMVQAVPAGGQLATAPPYASGTFARTVWAPLANGTNTNILVNGTPTSPVNFTYPSTAYPLPASGAQATMLKLVYSLKSIGFTGAQITSTAGLLGLGVSTQALPNGLLIGGTFGGVATQMAKVQINEDFFGFNGDAALIGGDSGRVLVAKILFAQPIAANGADKVQITVQDQMANISTANSLRAFVAGVALSA